MLKYNKFKMLKQKFGDKPLDILRFSFGFEREKEKEKEIQAFRASCPIH